MLLETDGPVLAITPWDVRETQKAQGYYWRGAVVTPYSIYHMAKYYAALTGLDLQRALEINNEHSNKFFNLPAESHGRS